MASQTLTLDHEVELPRLFYRHQPVITLAMMDKAHCRPVGTARRTFGQHRNKLIKGEDYFQLSSKEMEAMDEFRTSANPKGISLLTETGYLMLVKSFTDDLAWQVQRKLVKHYFRVSEPPEPPAPELLNTHDQSVCRSRIARHERQLRLASRRARLGIPVDPCEV